MSTTLTALATSAVTVALMVATLYKARRLPADMAELITLLRLRRERSGKPPRRPRLPSPTQGLLGLAERRLPAQMGAGERERWGREMRADVASLPRRHGLHVAFNAWRKGASKMPVGTDVATPITGD